MGVYNLNIDENIESINNMVESAKNALSQYLNMSQEKIDKIVKAMAEKAFNNSEKLAKMAIEETKMGVLKDKITKNVSENMKINKDKQKQQ